MLRVLSRCRQVLAVGTTIMESFTTSGLTFVREVVHYTLRRRATDEQQYLDARGSGPSLAHVARLPMYSARAPPTLHDVGRPCVGAGLNFRLLSHVARSEARCAARC